MFEYRAIYKRLYDADTIWFDIDLGFYTWLHYQPVRLTGIDAPELRGDERELGLLARDYTIKLFESRGPHVTLRTFKGDEQGKYGRWLAVVELSDGLVLNDHLVEAGHAEYAFY